MIVPVSDQDSALEFFGGREAHRGGLRRASTGSSPGADTTIALVPAQGAGPGEMEVSFATPDADAEVMRMGDYVPPMFTFRDPDGNRFRVVERD